MKIKQRLNYRRRKRDKKAARMMIIAGAEYGSVSNYSTWEYNLRFDMAVQNRVNSMYPSLMRPILFAERKI